MSQMFPPHPAGPGGAPPVPPALLALLGHGAAPPPSAGPVGPPPPAGGDTDQGGSEQEPIAILKQMIELGRKYVGVEPDEEDKATMSKVLSTLQSYLAKEQKENDQMLGGVMSPRAMRKLGGPQAG